MKHMNRLLFGLSLSLAFVIGCQKNPSPVRGKAGAGEQCSAALTTSMKALREANGKILESAKANSKITEAEKASHLSAKATVCADIVKSMGKAGTIDMADCTPAGTTAKITATEIKGLCVNEVAAAKAAVDTDKANALKNVTVVCGDAVKSLLQKLIDLEQKKPEIEALREKNKTEFAKQSKDQITEGVEICNQLYPKMPDVCKATFKKGEDFKKVEEVKAICQDYYATNTKLNKGTDVLPERTAATIEAGTTVKADQAAAGGGGKAGVTLRPGQAAQAELARRLGVAKKTLEEKRTAKTRADAELETAKAALALSPNDDDKKKAVTDKTEAAASAARELAAADQAVKDLEIAVKAAGIQPKVTLKAELAASLETEFAAGAKLKIENNSVLAKIAIKNADEAKNAWTEESVVLSAGEAITLKAHLEKNDKSVACRVLTTLSTGLSDGVVKVLSVNVEGSTDVMQAVTMNIEVPGTPATPLSIQCVKFSNEPMKKAELEAAMVKVVTIIPKPAAPAQRPAGAGDASPTPPVPAQRPAPAPQAASIPTEPTNFVKQFTDANLVLKFQDQSIVKTIIMTDVQKPWETTIAEITDENYGKAANKVSKVLGSNLRKNMTGLETKVEYDLGKTICMLARRGAKFGSDQKNYAQVVYRFEVWSADNVNQRSYVIMASKDTPSDALKERNVHETGLGFMCFKKSSEIMTKDDVILGLKNHFNAN